MDGAGSPRRRGSRGTTRVKSDSCSYREQGRLSLSESREEPVLLSTPGSSGLWRFSVVFKQVTHHL